MAAGLVEGDLVAGGDIEALPVDGELVAGLVDDHLVVRRRADLPLARDHLTTGWQVCSHCAATEQQGCCEHRTCSFSATAGVLICNDPGGKTWVPDEGIGTVHGLLPSTIMTDRLADVLCDKARAGKVQRRRLPSGILIIVYWT